jgi:hypothetical protein
MNDRESDLIIQINQFLSQTNSLSDLNSVTEELIICIDSILVIKYFDVAK